MALIDDHPIVQRVRTKPAKSTESVPMDADLIKQICRDCGADDVGIIAIDRPEIADQRAELMTVFNRTRSVIAFLCVMNREPVRSPFRSVANREFHTVGHEVDKVAHEIVKALGKHGIPAVNPSMAFPMEAKRFPDQKSWIVSHKPIAVAAGLGQMGIHRNVIHPKFGNFVLLGTILIGVEVTQEDHPITYNPCVQCKLCVTACPVGAIGADGWFNFNSCYTHNYREFLGGFSSWVETVVESKDMASYREQVSDGETVSMWQSLAFGPNYNAAYCIAVCPAGEDVMGQYLDNKRDFLATVVKPLQEREETVYVTAKSDAAPYVAKRFPYKKIKVVRNGAHTNTVQGFVRNILHFFQRDQSEGLDAVYHFSFFNVPDSENLHVTVTIRDKTIRVENGLIGTSGVYVSADAKTWVGFLNKEVNLGLALIRRRIRIKGNIRLLPAFSKCFPA